MSELPAGWAACQLSDIGQIVTGKTPSTKEPHFYGGNIPFIKPGDLDRSGPILSTETYLTEDGAAEVPSLPPQSIVVTCIGNLGKVGLTTTTSATNQQINAVIPHEGVNPSFLFHYCKTLKPWLEAESSATTISIVNKGIFSTAPISLPPLAEQSRIAQKLDELLAQADTLKARFDAIPALLKRFRQSVLAAAVSGRLTEECRGASEDLNPDVPLSWTSPQIKDVGRVQLGRQRSPKYHSGENMKPYLRVQNVFEDRLDLADVMEMDFPGADFERYKLYSGDILLNEGQSPELLGRPAMFNGEIEGACFTNTLIRFQAGSGLAPKYALFVFRHYMHSGRFRSIGTITTNIAHLGAGRFAELPFPLPPLTEQNEIIHRVEQLFACADQLEAKVATAQAHIDRLTQSILAKAFRGELVPQDPNDEPASLLLERIKAQRAAAPKAKRGRKASA